MSTQIVGLHRPAHIRLRKTIPFRATSERGVAVPCGVDEEAQRRERSLVCCQPGGAPRRGIDCQDCPRFLMWRGCGEALRVRCAWSDHDRVRDCMTLAGALIVIHSDMSCAAADELARRHQLSHLLVVDGLSLVGVVSRRDLRGGGRVAERMARDVYAVLGQATLGEAVAAMTSLEIGLLPVIGERFVIGALSRVDLLRIGVPRQLFAPPPRTLAEAYQIERGDLEEAPAPALDDDSDLIPLPEDTLA